MDTVATVPFSSARAYLLEARYEFLRLLRTPSFSLPCLLFPPVFYLLFGVLLGGKGGPVAAQYLLAGYGVFGVIGVALFGFGVTVALDREQGLLTLKRAQPMPPGAYLVAKMAMALLFAAIILLLLAALAAGVAHVLRLLRDELEVARFSTLPEGELAVALLRNHGVAARAAVVVGS